ncbi:MAG: TonB-dependent receptor [Betaproteobacteria bacterium]|nr:TonB-dependent receptor [Betaproteobacteria bacterium]
MLRSSSRVLAAAGILVSLPAAADDSELRALRAEIEQLRTAYEQRLASLEARLQSAEQTRSTPAAEPPSDDRRPLAAPAGGFNPEVSLILQGQYKNMKDVGERSITGFASTAGHGHGDGIDGVSKRGFSVEHSELVLSANIDPYWRGQAIVAVRDGDAEVEEAWFQSLAIGHGIGLKGGRFRSGIGYLNEQHAHAWDFADAPLMYRVLFGEEGRYTQDGLQLKWLAPTPMFLEFGAELGRGADFPGSERNKNGAGAGAVFAHIGDDVGIEHSWRAGVSYLRTRAGERESRFADINGREAAGSFAGRSLTWIADFVWKWAPNGNPGERNFKFQAEYFQRREKGSLDCYDETGAGNACDPLAAGERVVGDYRTRQSGWHAQSVYQFLPRWRAGLRYEQLDSGSRHFGANAANLAVASYRPKTATAMLDYRWSEFSRLRLQYAQDKSMRGLSDKQWTLQYVMSLGAHGAHGF